jgi:uncharacterized protein (TIGR03435 family)
MATPHSSRSTALRLRQSFRYLLAAAVLGLPPALVAQMPLPMETAGTDAAGVKLPAYDTVSIRENKGDSHMMRVMNKANGFECTNLPVVSLIANAYRVRQDLISGLPEWAASAHFDVNAKVADEDLATFKKLSDRQRDEMLLAMLQDRFKLQAHKETPTLPIFDLVVDKGGPKFTESTATPPTPGEPFDPNSKVRHAGSMMMGAGRLSVTGVPMQSLSNQLAYSVGKTVVDKTGLTGKYDFELRWTPEGKTNSTDNGTDEAPADIFTALREQLGLKLVPSKGPVETLVVDHIEKPSEN